MVAGVGDIDGQDIVVWYANRFSHFTRDEDQDNMPIEWLSFEVQPRSFNHRSPLE
jgi:primary-amine oxidase